MEIRERYEDILLLGKEMSLYLLELFHKEQRKALEMNDLDKVKSINMDVIPKFEKLFFEFSLEVPEEFQESEVEKVEELVYKLIEEYKIDEELMWARVRTRLELAENSGMITLILDSITSEWQGSGGCLEIHEQLGGRWQDWAKVTPRHQAFIDAILQSKCHVITCVRRKIEYSLDTDSNGRMKVTKLGTKEQTREGFEYELTVNFEIINENHLSKASKDRTGLFMNKPEFVINSSTGVKLISWARSTMTKDELQLKISECNSIKELGELYHSNPELSKTLDQEFVAKKNLLNELTSKITPNGHNSSYPKSS